MYYVETKESLCRLISRPFIRHVATVATGTAASQAIVMIFSPFITRLYGTEAYGQQGVFVSLVNLLGVVAVLRYPLAIVLPRSDTDALGLAYLSLLLGIGTTIVTAVVLYFCGTDVLKLLHAEAIASFVFLLPVAVFIAVLGSVLGQWLVRKKEFRVTAKYGFLTTLLVSVIKTGLGFLHPTALVLILTNTMGALMGTIITYLGWRKQSQGHSLPATLTHSVSLINLAKKYRDFPLLRTPQELLNVFSQNLPVLLLASYFGVSSAGQYAIAIAVLGLPALVGGSVASVFYPRITEAIQNSENARALIIKATAGMAVIGILPYLAIIIAGPFLFELGFGEGWRTAGAYAQWLSVWLFLQYIAQPAVCAIPALKLQGGMLVYEVINTGTKIFALWLGFKYFESDVAAIAIFSVFGASAYAWLLLWVIYQSKFRKLC